MKPKIIQQDFYLQPTLKVARELLGKILYRKLENGEILSGKIVETEAYLKNDSACHASRGKTERNKIMFGPAGHAYVYFTYGMHYCFNVVTQLEGIPEAVLIRAVEPLEGIETMERNRKTTKFKNLTNGPAKLTQAFGIDKELNGVDLTRGNFVILDDDGQIGNINRAPRNSRMENVDKLWRYYTDSEGVSKR